MSTVTIKKIRQLAQAVKAPYGNVWKDKFVFQTNSSGVFANSDKTSAVAQNDVVRLGILPAGLELADYLAIISDAFTASVTSKFGFAYVDGVDDSTVPQDDDFFATALAMDSTGVSRKTAVTRPVILPKDAYFIMTVGGASHASAGIVDLYVEGIYHGNP